MKLKSPLLSVEAGKRKEQATGHTGSNKKGELYARSIMI